MGGGKAGTVSDAVPAFLLNYSFANHKDAINAAVVLLQLFCVSQRI